MTRLAEIESAHEVLAGQLAALEWRAALEDRDRAALATRLDDRDAELRRAIAAHERSDAAAATECANLAAALESEAARRTADAVAHAEGLEHLHTQSRAAHVDLAAVAARHASAEAILPPGLATTVSDMARRGDLGLAAALTELADPTSNLAPTSFLTDPVAEIVRSAERFVRSEHAFLKDIRLTKELLVSTDLARIVDGIETPSMRTLLADLDRVADIAR